MQVSGPLNAFRWGREGRKEGERMLSFSPPSLSLPSLSASISNETGAEGIFERGRGKEVGDDGTVRLAIVTMIYLRAPHPFQLREGLVSRLNCTLIDLRGRQQKATGPSSPASVSRVCSF